MSNPVTVVHPLHTNVVLPLGRIIATRGALDSAGPQRIAQCITAHAMGDWGCVCDADKRTNDLALQHGDRILSAYPIDPSRPSKGYGDNTLWVITEWDRSVTTALLPEEY